MSNIPAAAGAAAARLGVLWRIVDRRAGYVVGAAGTRVIRLFTDDIGRTTTIDSLIGGSNQLGCTEGPAGSSSSGPFD